MVRKTLLACGIASSLLYVAMNVFIPPLFDGYTVASQTVSELSAIGAPTRALWVPLGLVYAVLVVAFGWGVWASAAGNRRLRVAASLLIINGAISFAWPPMHLRGEAMTSTDVMHIVFSIVTVLLMFLTIGFGAFAFGKPFRWFSLATIAVFLVFGTLTALDAPRLAANLPTPRLGVWERINIGAYMLWLIVLALRVMGVGARGLTAAPGGATKVAEVL